jgi:antitoxin component YwqK of YwqJK toxin-antitoxin module
MFKLDRFFVPSFLIVAMFFFSSCKKEVVTETITSNDGVQARLAYTDQGYTEIEVNPIVKIKCYFSEWNKDVMTPISGLFEYYDADGNLVASIDFGNGTCDEWATKTWDIDVFPDYPSGSTDFSVFGYKDKK